MSLMYTCINLIIHCFHVLPALFGLLHHRTLTISCSHHLILIIFAHYFLLFGKDVAYLNAIKIIG